MQQLKTHKCMVSLVLFFSLMLFSFQVQAAENEFRFGTEKVALQEGSYLVSVYLKSSVHLDTDSAMKDGVEKYGLLTVKNTGEVSMEITLRKASIGTTDVYIEQPAIYQTNATSGATVPAKVISWQKNANNQEVPERISFSIPSDTYSANGVFLSVYIDAIQNNVNSFLYIDYSSAKLTTDSSLDYTKTGSAEQTHYGYGVDVSVTVSDGRISNVDITGRDFTGAYIEENQRRLNMAIEGMKDKFNGIADKDDTAINQLDAVSGATGSSRTIRKAVLNALELDSQPQENNPEPPDTIPSKGTYSVKISNTTDVVDYSLLSENISDARLTVADDSSMLLTYEMESGRPAEPVYVLDFNGYYKDNDISSPYNYTKKGVSLKNETKDGFSVVKEVSMPLSGLSANYYTNNYLYAPILKNIAFGSISGIPIRVGKFDIMSTITVYWDTLQKIDDDSDDNTGSSQNKPDTDVSKDSGGKLSGGNSDITFIGASLQKGQRYRYGKNVYEITSVGKTNTVQLDKVSAKTKKVTIPSTIEINGQTCKVTSIGKKAFYKKKRLRSIIIPESVQTVGANAFRGCKNLKKVTIRSSRLKIGKNAFSSINKNAVFKINKKLKKKQEKSLITAIKKSGVSKNIKIRR